jgi:hypothetical protein
MFTKPDRSFPAYLRYYHMRQVLLFLFLGLVLHVEARLPDLIPYRKGNLWGYCDSAKKIVIEPQWHQAGLFEGGKAAIMLNGKWGIIDSLGQLLLHPKYFYAFSLGSTRFAAYTDATHAGVVDDKDSVIIPFTSRWVGQDADSVIHLSIDRRMIVCDLNGKRILTEEYFDWDCGTGDAAKFGLFIVSRQADMEKRRNRSNNFIVVDTADRQVVPGKYEWIKLIGDSILSCERGDSLEYFDLKGNPVVNFPYVEERLSQREQFRPWFEKDLTLITSTWMEGRKAVFKTMGYQSRSGVKYWED